MLQVKNSIISHQYQKMGVFLIDFIEFNDLKVIFSLSL